MTNSLQQLVDRARRHRMSNEEREEQRRSFAYGNAGIENPLITRKMVDQEADLLREEEQRRHGGAAAVED